MIFSFLKSEYKGEEVENGEKGEIITVLGGKNIIWEKGGGAKISYLGQYLQP